MTYQECIERLQAAQRALNAVYALEALIEDTDDALDAILIAREIVQYVVGSGGLL